MADEDDVSHQQYRADLADFRADMARFREEVRTDLAAIRVDIAHMEVRVTRWVPIAAGIGGLLGGLIAAATKIFG